MRSRDRGSGVGEGVCRKGGQEGIRMEGGLEKIRMEGGLERIRMEGERYEGRDVWWDRGRSERSEVWRRRESVGRDIWRKGGLEEKKKEGDQEVGRSGRR